MNSLRQPRARRNHSAAPFDFKKLRESLDARALANSGGARSTRGPSAAPPRSVTVDHPKRPAIKPGSTFDTLEDVLAALGVAVEEYHYDMGRWISPARWQVGMLKAGTYNRDRCVLKVPPGPGRSVALEWGIGVELAKLAGLNWRDDSVVRATFERAALNILHLPAVVDELPPIRWRNFKDWPAAVTTCGIEVIQANAAGEAPFDPEDRQTAMVHWDERSEVVLAVLPVEPDEDDYDWLSEKLGVNVRELPVTVRPEFFLEEAQELADRLRAWRAAHPSTDAREAA